MPPVGSAVNVKAILTSTGLLVDDIVPPKPTLKGSVKGVADDAGIAAGFIV